MYERVLVGLDGSDHSDLAMDASLRIAKSCDSMLIGCHVYAAEMHRARFAEMEIGLPERYQDQERLGRLRDTHEDIISGGMRIISDAYMTPLFEQASKQGVRAEGTTPEGRNYVKFTQVAQEKRADLIIIGAQGQGKVPESTMGGFADRVLLLNQGPDILLMRKAWSLKGRPIVVGVDGSENSFQALRRAAQLAKVFGAYVQAVAVYDPFFHSGVFSSISEALTKEQASKFNFAAQQRLHDEIIDGGLLSLYGQRLDQGIDQNKDIEVRIEKIVLTGKVYCQLSHHASAVNAGLLVMGRFGIHRDPMSLIGSNASSLARLTTCNLLIVVPETERTIGLATVAELVASGAEPPHIEAGPGPKASEAAHGSIDALGSSTTGDLEAELVVMRKAKRLAPGFHEHIAKARIQGAMIEQGGRFLVYDIIETVPSGKVRVTPQTKLEFV